MRILLVAWILGLISSVPAAAQTPPGGSTDIVATESYSFHSDFWANLHDYLYWRGREGGPANEGAVCLIGLAEIDLQGWLRATAFYNLNMSERHHRVDDLMRALRYRMSGVAELDHDMMSVVHEYLGMAAPAYRECFWEEHDAANRARVATIVPELESLGAAVKERMSELYAEAWPEQIHVDVIPFASFAGANTASGRDVPPHMAISSRDPDLVGLSGLELLIHEASHEMFGARHGTLGIAINAAAADLDVSAPRSLWHALSFYTSGFVMKEVTRDAGRPEYVPYWVRSGVMRRAWPDYLEPIQENWEPYLRGEAELESSLHSVIRAIVE